MEELNKIFKTNPALLKEPEVVNLIAHCEKRFNEVKSRVEELRKFEDFVLHEYMTKNITDAGHSILNYLDKNE